MLTEKEREWLSWWDNGCYSCACVEEVCPAAAACQNDRNDLTTSVEAIIVERLELAAQLIECEAPAGIGHDALSSVIFDVQKRCAAIVREAGQ
jgi:hypothetical protein